MQLGNHFYQFTNVSFRTDLHKRLSKRYFNHSFEISAGIFGIIIGLDRTWKFISHMYFCTILPYEQGEVGSKIKVVMQYLVKNWWKFYWNIRYKAES